MVLYKKIKGNVERFVEVKELAIYDDRVKYYITGGKVELVDYYTELLEVALYIDGKLVWGNRGKN